MNDTSSPGVLRNVQALRALAACMVVIFHLDAILARLGVVAVGGAGVDIFFVISGFIMVYTTYGRGITPVQFAADRIARIVPTYWVLTLAVFLLAMLAPSLLGTTTANWVNLLKSLTFIPYIKSAGIMEPVLFVGWSLNYEMFFYALFAVGLAFPKRLGAVFVLAALATLVTLGEILRPTVGVLYFYTTWSLAEFAFGMIIGLSFAYLPRIESQFGWSAVLTLGTLSFAILVPQGFHWPHLSGTVVGAFLAAMIILSAVLLDRADLSVRSPLVLLIGNASYSLYLTHPFVTQLVQKFDASANPNMLLDVVLIPITLALAVGVAIANYRLVEMPLTYLARDKLANWRGLPRRRGQI